MGGLTGPAAEISIGNVVSGGTPGSVLFVGAGGVLAEDNANLFWNDTSKILSIGGGPSKSSLPSITISTSGNEIASSGAAQLLLSANAYYNAGWKYGNANPASQIGLENGVLYFNTSPAGAADAALTWDKQVQINPTPGATRYITLTGSNGGNPTIGTSAGSLAISSAVAAASDLSVAGQFNAAGNVTATDTVATAALIGGATLNATGAGDYLVGQNITSLTMNAGATGAAGAMGLRIVGAGMTKTGAGAIANAASLWIDNAPAIAANNFSIYVAAGQSTFGGPMQLLSLGAFAAGDKYLIVDAAGNVHVSALGPAS